MSKEQLGMPPLTKEEDMAREICERWPNGVPPWDMIELEEVIVEALRHISTAAPDAAEHSTDFMPYKREDLWPPD